MKQRILRRPTQTRRGRFSRAAFRFHGCTCTYAEANRARPEGRPDFPKKGGGFWRRGSGRWSRLRGGTMAGGWAGFSERELRQLQGHRKDLPGPPFKKQNQGPSINKSRQCLQQKKAPQKIEKILELPDGAALSPLEKAEKQEARNQQVEVELKQSCNSDPTAATSHQLVKKKMELQERSRWEILQEEQKLMEEKNKRKKAFLAKAIAERKRYEKAELEYVAAKLDLQKKTDVKEQLAEHLSTIIQQNELRKAKKLEELMKELEVEADEENLELEIEVEQMLQQQETEARSQEIETQKLAQVDVQCTDSQTLSKEHENENLTNINGAT
ncbi:RAB6-interacting golgin isoform X1 [Erythrolamprus reginae]|uniref:RAB6-interacting golgin isoform X1 n=1 Tax=Erythrolamprus reginae TaxID=121349 RepID=UPI00396C6320